MSRNEILRAAAIIFSEKGYHAASMQDIARAVNRQKASLYHHVSSKQEILLALLDLALDVLIEQVSGIMDEPLPADEKIRQAIHVYLQTLTDQRDLASILLFEHRSLDSKLKTRHLPRRDRFEQLWKDCVREGVETEIFDCDDPALAARGLLGIMNWTLTWYRADGALSAQEIAEQFSKLFLKGIVTR